MGTIFREPAFWAFSTACVGCIRWLARVFYLYAEKKIKAKADAESGSEKIKSDYAVQTVTAIKGVVDSLLPVIERHESTLLKIDSSIKDLTAIHQKTDQMMSELNLQYEGFQSRMNQVNKGAELVMDKIKSIETEIVELKKGSGNVFVTQKK
jgi:predicted  nucleic acid-binding Zn-ribbon protein